MNELVLSLFPGIGLLDMAFEEEGFCVVRGPDLLWGGDIKRFHPPAGKFDGVIGGPPCQTFSPMTNIVRARYGENAVAKDLIPEFERCIREAQPRWFLMENVRRAPHPSIDEYAVSDLILNNRSFGAEQNRVRRVSFGIHGRLSISLLRSIEYAGPLEAQRFEYAVMAGHGKGGHGLAYHRTPETARKIREAHKRPLERAFELQGLPRNFLEGAPFTSNGKYQAVGNGVPLPMGRAVAKAVRLALEARR